MMISQKYLRNCFVAALFLSIAWSPSVYADTTNRSTGASDPQAASELMKTAHEARYTWESFPGFTAELTVLSDERVLKGKIHVDSDLEYTVDLVDGQETPRWLESKLRSVIGHRRNSESGPKSAQLLNENSQDEAYGIQVQADDGSGVFRIVDGRIADVVRKSDGRWFEITNVDLLITPDNKYLPSVTSVSYRDPDTGDLTENRTNHFTWTQKGGFYLPEKCFTVITSDNGGREIQQVTFSGHEFLDRSEEKIQLDAGKATTFSSDPQLHRPLLEALASFGASILGDHLYVFSGHAGDMHGFGKDLLVNHFRRLNLKDPNAQWEELAMHDSAQSAALVNDGKYLYRIGGLSYRNNTGESKADFDSTTYFSRYDVESNTWTELAPLPVGRSSLDAAVLGRKIYVVGGWNLQGSSSSSTPWHENTLVFDLDAPEKGWTELPGPGYRARALSAAAHDGKVYIIGGIQSRGFSKKVSAYDPETNSWSDGPDIPSDSSTAGFATSCFAIGGDLYFTGSSGILYRLSKDGKSWEIADRLLVPRMFLRLLPLGDDRLVAVGGTNSMGSGRLAAIESLKVDNKQVAAPKQVSWTVPFEGRAKHSQVLVLDGYNLYAFGGNASNAPHDFSKEAFVDEAFVFDLLGQKVEELPKLPRALQSGAGVLNRLTSEHNSIALLGGLGFGEEKSGSINDVLVFDRGSKTWIDSHVSIPGSRGMHDAVVKNDAIWVFGGSDSSADRRLASSVLHWWGDESAIGSLPKVSVPHPRRSFGGATIGDEYFMIGGLGEGSKIVSEIDVFNFDKRTWRSIPSPKNSRVFPSVFSQDKKIYLYGGFSTDGGHFAPCTVLEVYDSETNEWSVVADSVDGVDASMRMIGLHGRILFYGIEEGSSTDGGQAQAKFVIYDPTPMAAPTQALAMSFTGRSRGSQATANAKSMMRQDTDKDGKLSVEELGSRFAGLIERGDKDGDSLLDMDELREALEADEAKDEVKEEETTVEAGAAQATSAVEEGEAK